uniref:Uncharacterized protein n=1 Tax=Amphimedon queenslandica TaxID=400682 RepID=A0A1X7T9U0_AMPQE
MTTESSSPVEKKGRSRPRKIPKCRYCCAVSPLKDLVQDQLASFQKCLSDLESEFKAQIDELQESVALLREQAERQHPGSLPAALVPEGGHDLSDPVSSNSQ